MHSSRHRHIVAFILVFIAIFGVLCISVRFSRAETQLSTPLPSHRFTLSDGNISILHADAQATLFESRITLVNGSMTLHASDVFSFPFGCTTLMTVQSDLFLSRTDTSMTVAVLRGGAWLRGCNDVMTFIPQGMQVQYTEHADDVAIQYIPRSWTSEHPSPFSFDVFVPLSYESLSSSLSGFACPLFLETSSLAIDDCSTLLMHDVDFLLSFLFFVEHSLSSIPQSFQPILQRILSEQSASFHIDLLERADRMSRVFDTSGYPLQAAFWHSTTLQLSRAFGKTLSLHHSSSQSSSSSSFSFTDWDQLSALLPSNIVLHTSTTTMTPLSPSRVRVENVVVNVDGLDSLCSFIIDLSTDMLFEIRVNEEEFPTELPVGVFLKTDHSYE